MKLKKFGGTEKKVYDLVKPITDELEYFLWDISYVREGAMWYLRVFIDRDEGIGIEDCEKVTAPVSSVLDEADPIQQSYVLEVGSAGLERELVREEHFQACIGDTVRVRLIRSINGIKEIIGELKGFDKECVTLLTQDGTEESFSLGDIAFVKLYFDISSI